MTPTKKLALLLFISFLMLPSNVYCEDNLKLTPSGNVVEMLIYLKHPYINSCLDDSNKKLQTSDIILSIEHNQNKITSYDKIYELMKLSNEKIKVTYIRKGREETKKMTTDDLRAYKFTNYLPCAGTITAIDKYGNYIALSHDIRINKSAITIDKGLLFETAYVQEKKSTEDSIGYLMTTSNNQIIGTVETMNKYGIQGKYTDFKYDNDKAFETSKPKTGTAYIYCETPITNEIKFHEIRILEVGAKSSKIQILDKDLLSYRGGGANQTPTS